MSDDDFDAPPPPEPAPGHEPRRRALPWWMRKADGTAVGEDPTPAFVHQGPVHYVTDSALADRWVRQLRREVLHPVLGFDLEWRANMVRGAPPNRTALLQLAARIVTDERLGLHRVEAFLFQLAAMVEFPGELRRLLEDGAFAKTGVNVAGDAQRLLADFGVAVAGCIELNAGSAPRASLQLLTRRHLELSLSKDKAVRCSDWEYVPLTLVQRRYAVADAVVGLLIWEKQHWAGATCPQPDLDPSEPPEPPDDDTDIGLATATAPSDDELRLTQSQGATPRKRRWNELETLDDIDAIPIRGDGNDDGDAELMVTVPMNVFGCNRHLASAHCHGDATVAGDDGDYGDAIDEASSDDNADDRLLASYFDDDELARLVEDEAVEAEGCFDDELLPPHAWDDIAPIDWGPDNVDADGDDNTVPDHELLAAAEC